MRIGRLSIGYRSSDTTTLLALSLAAMWVIGCSSNLMQPSGASASEVEAFKRRIVDLQKRATVGEVEVKRLEREVARLEAQLARARLVATPEPPPVETETVPQIVEYLEPEIEESDLDEPPIFEETIVQEARVPEVSAPPTPSTKTVPTQLPSASTPEEAQGLYDEGYSLFHQQSYPDAEARFQRYVDLYPETELADNALFWVGASRYATGDYSAALEAFSATVERFPQGNKVADALFKAGRCLESLGELDQALSTYREVDRRYPGSAASAQARERLEALR